MIFQIGGEMKKLKIISKEIPREVLDVFNIIKSSGLFKFISKIQKEKEFTGMICEALGKIFENLRGMKKIPNL